MTLKAVYVCGQAALIPMDYDVSQVTHADLQYDCNVKATSRDMEDLGALAAINNLDALTGQAPPLFWQGVKDQLVFAMDLMQEHDDPDFVAALRDGNQLCVSQWNTSIEPATLENIWRYARAHSRLVGILDPDISSVVALTY